MFEQTISLEETMLLLYTSYSSFVDSGLNEDLVFAAFMQRYGELHRWPARDVFGVVEAFYITKNKYDKLKLAGVK